MNRAVFFDRDGTLISEVDYKDNSGHYAARRPEDVVFLPNVMEGLQLLSQYPYKIIIVTNQSGVSRGLYTLNDMKMVNQRICEILERNGVHVDDIYYCPHLSEAKCICRKPNIYMLQRASEKHSINLLKSYMVGNSEVDIQTGVNAGCTTILIGNMKNYNTVKPDVTVSTLMDAIKVILEN